VVTICGGPWAGSGGGARSRLFIKVGSGARDLRVVATADARCMDSNQERLRRTS
jgi:hypothetical protein